MKHRPFRVSVVDDATADNRQGTEDVPSFTSEINARPFGWGGISAGFRLLGTVLFNSLIAVILSLIGFGGSFGVNLIFSQCIGLSILLALELALSRQLPPRLRLPATFAAVMAGTLLGTLLAMIITNPMSPTESATSAIYWQAVLIGLVAGGVGVSFFLSREQLLKVRATLQEQQLRALKAEKQRVETQLRLLQAQTEPHFLFNTLAHVLSLIDSDAARAKQMLLSLNGYLRQSLFHARRSTSTLGQEFELLDAYLRILKIRMNERLHIHLDCPEALTDLPLPPMLLHPLVENSIKHGLETNIEGGELRVTARRSNRTLCLEVSDTGSGLSDTAPNSGTGLSNLRERLAALYGKEAGLELEDNEPRGVVARIRLPLRDS